MRYLIVKLSSFGDVAQAICILNFLKQKDPHCIIDWVVEAKIAPLVAAHPLVNTVFPIEIKKIKKNPFSLTAWKELWSQIRKIRSHEYDAVFDFQGNIKSGFITACVHSNDKVGFGWKTAAERLNCCFTTHRYNPPSGQNIRRDYLFLVQAYFKDFSVPPCEEVYLQLSSKEEDLLESCSQTIEAPCWMICPGSYWKHKRLPIETLREFLKKCDLLFHPQYAFIAGVDDEVEMAHALSADFPNSFVLRNLHIPVLQHVMRKMDLIVAMDSFPLHLAGTTCTPTVSFFGPSLSCKYRPIGDRHFSFQGDCLYKYVFEKRCPRLKSCPTAACLRDQRADTLFATFSHWWSQRLNHEV